MLHLVRSLALLAPLLATASCVGGLENDLFSGHASVDGTLPGPIDSARAWVAIDGQPRLAGGVASDGSFSIANVPVGQRVVLASNGVASASEQQLLVLAERPNPVVVEWSAGATIQGQIFFEGDDLARRADVGIAGLPLQTKTAVDGHFKLPALPAGCYDVYVRHPLHRESRTETCVETGATSTVVLYLRLAPTTPTPTPDGGTPPLEPLCAPCQTHGECASGLCAIYSHASADEQICTQGCTEDAECPRGYICGDLEYNGMRGCVPPSASCSASANLGAECESAGDCGLDDSDGVCVEQHCTLRCEETHDCPDGQTCQLPSGGDDLVCA